MAHLIHFNTSNKLGAAMTAVISAQQEKLK
ncbi:hypothetical protein A2U01_0092107, partial [Trifolium medium]|nr:hypothetical protein [Trifolium medium]